LIKEDSLQIKPLRTKSSQYPSTFWRHARLQLHTERNVMRMEFSGVRMITREADTAFTESASAFWCQSAYTS
jgi:hypothetical protein